ncbi:hypothetical protein MKEN_01344300 [Mycena kentingensis (nom. inval.)]|nr:hypothetical protein MKEN_01344300 [Mycena kentingensis (nom. inval.)]
MSESPFTIAVPDSKLRQLKQKLAIILLPDELKDTGWDYGAPLADIRRLGARWKDDYDWRVHERQINDELPQFTRDINVHGTLNVHYVHKKSEVTGAIPLLFVHGWPGNFLEVRKILPLLVKGGLEHLSFHVVAVSLPGYGFLEAPRTKGFRLDQYAEVANKLMLALGYNEYGFQVTRRIARYYGDKHSPFTYVRALVTPYTTFEVAGIERTRWFETKGRGYFAIHATKPQTLGYALEDSPVSLLAWIYEKLPVVTWTDGYEWDDDEILTWISSYYFSRAGPAATLHIYYELHNGNKRYPPASESPAIPMGISLFPKELIIAPPLRLQRHANFAELKSPRMERFAGLFHLLLW